MRQNKYEYDAFISHAVEDKIPIANELCAKLEMAGLRIWYSGKELGVGDSIEKTIEKGLNRSRYGIVIFSPTYLAKNWTIREFYTLLAKEIEEQKVILPVLYNITLDELKNKDLLMADRFAVNSDRGIDFVVDRLVKEIRKPKVETAKVAWFSRIWLILILSLLANVALVTRGFWSMQEPISAARQSQFTGSQLVKPALIHEMQGLFEQFNTCRCNHADPEYATPVIATASLANSPNRLQVAADGDRSNVAGHRAGSSRKAGGKMTMAVVFQIETDPDEGDHNLEGDVSDMLETITLAERDRPFMTVSTPGQQQRECSHVSHLGE